MSEPLHLAMRPKIWKDVIGHTAQVQALKAAIEARSSQAFLLAGPSGIGKTTLARIAASALGCQQDGLNEIDAATFTGIDAMRAVAQTLHYFPFGSPVRVIILDEAHRLSGPAWDSLLKAIEEPPKHVFWFFCTTALIKLPRTVRTRCLELQLRPLSVRDLEVVLKEAVAFGQFKLAKGVLELLAFKADGSPRQALTMLEKVADLDYRTAAELLEEAEETVAIVALCRALVNGDPNRRSWRHMLELVRDIEESPESIRIVVCKYLAKALGNSANRGARTRELLRLLEAFSVSYNPAEGLAPLYRSLGQAVFGESQHGQDER